MEDDNLLSRLLEMKTLVCQWQDNWYSFNVARDPTTPPMILEDILKRNISYNISQNAAKNPNCPPEVKIKWMKENGLIEKEDTSKHIIEYEIIKEDDLQDLKDLLKNC